MVVCARPANYAVDRMRRLIFCVVLGGAIGCGGPASHADDGGDDVADASIDSPKSRPCWLDTYTPAGSIKLGTGANQYIPMPDHIALEFGTQLGYDIPVHAEMMGLMPGNPIDTLDPANPHTRFHGFFVDTGDPVNPGRCGTSLGYKPAAGGAFDLVTGAAVIFDNSLTATDLMGRQVRVVVEIIDAAGNYATDEKIVTCDIPPM